jgi:hypothetical protein
MDAEVSMRHCCATYKRIRTWRFILACLLGAGSGYFTWSVAVKRLGPQPLYEICWDQPGTQPEVKTAGPWLFVSMWNRQRPRPDHIEIRNLRDGVLDHTIKWEPTGRVPGRALSIVDHPQLGPDTLLHTWQSDQALHVGYLQPRTNQTEVVGTFPNVPWVGPNAAFGACGNGSRILQSHLLLMAPFLLLGGQGLPDLVAADFHSMNSGNNIVLLRIRDSQTWKLLGSFSLSNSSGNYLRNYLTWEGDAILSTSTGLSHWLQTYFTQYPPASLELLEQLIKSTCNFQLLDATTGAVLWESPIVATFLPIRFHPGYMHLISKKYPADDRYRGWIFLPQTRKLVEVPFDIDDHPVQPRVPEHPRVTRTKPERVGDKTLHTEVTCMEFDLEGKQTSWIRFDFKGSGGAAAIEGTNQFLSLRTSSPPGYKGWRSLVERWKWLERIPYSWSTTLSLIDADAEVSYPLASAMQPESVDWQVTPGGGYLLLMHKDRNQTMRAVQVYELPIPPQPLWRRWGPLVLGWIAGLAVAAVILFVRRRKKLQPA